MRQLATIKTIESILPIDGRDRIELAIIDGWSVIVKKNEFQVGDRCIYCEIDSVLPDRPEFDFLREKKFRIKTMKMAGVVSQGICFPTNLLKKDYPIGTDVTKDLGIVQYEATRDIERDIESRPPIKQYPKWLMRFNWFRELIYKLDHRRAKGFPEFISKTDETRIESLPWLLNDRDRFWTCSEKLDGTSSTYALKRHRTWYGKSTYEFIVCSRNLRLFAKDDSVYWKVAIKYSIEDILKKIIGENDFIAIQGEILAPNIQKNKYKVTEPEFYAFNFIYPKGRIDSLSARRLIEEQGLKFVPILSEMMILPETIDEIHKFVNFQSKLGSTLAEGCVFRSIDGKQSFKSVNPLFLIQYDE